MMKETPKNNVLFYGDCLEWMKSWPDTFVDLMYLDPPFNSNTDYNVLYSPTIVEQAEAQKKAFKDTWHWDDAAIKRVHELEHALAHPAHKAIIGLKILLGEKYLGGSGMLAYLSYMAERLAEMKRLLKPTGSIYLHCDPHASHYLKILMDGIFGKKNFRNEIVWRIGWVSGYKTQKKGWIRNHDTLLYYVKDKDHFTFNKEYIPYPKGYKRRDGSPPEGKGIPIEDTWNCSAGDVLDSIMIKSFSKEKTGYDTQKPLKLLERIIKASSNKGDIVLDPFCGCGTTVLATDCLERKFLGIDISPLAIELVKYRFQKGTGNKSFTTLTNSKDIAIEGLPTTMDGAKKLAKDKPFSFEEWAITRILGLVPNDQKVGDKGIDGRGVIDLPDEQKGDPQKIILAQVTGGKFNINHFKSFCTTIENLKGKKAETKAAMGVYITLEPVTSPQAKEIMVDMGTITIGKQSYSKLQNWTIEDFFANIEVKLPPMLDPFTGKKMLGILGI